MKLKNIYIPIAASLIGAGVLMSCGDSFTDLSPISQRNVNLFYNTAGDMNTAINAAYKTLQLNGTYNQSYWITQEMRSDNTDQGPDGTGLGADLTVIENFVENSTSELVTLAYTDSYLGIARSNIVLSRLDAVDMPSADKERIRGEALFLRSLFFYNLAVSFGNIPLPLTEAKSVDEGKALPQVPAADVYKQLIPDLIKAESGLLVKYDAANVGRATKGAAATLLAKVYLAAGDKKSAETVLRRIIASYGYSLVPNYANLWGLANKNNVESIFEVQFKGGATGTGNAFTNAFSPTLKHSTGAYKNRPTQSILKEFEAGDDRFIKSMDTSYVNTQGVLVTNTKNDIRYVVKFGRENSFEETDASYNFVVFRYADVLLMLAEALGEGTEAYALINQVRARAKLAPVSATTTGTFAQKLLHERRVELAFENHRWADLLRFGVAKDVMLAQGKTIRPLFLIPQRELDINKSYKQN
ncbi:RagB/SusD family nutrient uptake outer membrane protein [Dyadobacter psychrotolerans]|uniref:RagB/SusD family nutrient uptake outer membrane protein n=1 Tax=Dyadobacter psychrotolerans TaxID=2541721 RepID=A0A4R5E2F0_9BACT|nr:RagB/SusD family nutrient uptake outer membrane protein [Dyadobacter psychrotolerans]TDE18515.1 RagB/SusD family nutrient uptake outer membrane protein [Dyadobacter psychrotolerans]